MIPGSDNILNLSTETSVQSFSCVRACRTSNSHAVVEQNTRSIYVTTLESTKYKDVTCSSLRLLIQLSATKDTTVIEFQQLQSTACMESFVSVGVTFQWSENYLNERHGNLKHMP